MYYFIQSLARIVLPTVFRLTVTGAQGVPTDGAVLLCSNHGSNWDPILLGTFVDRKVAFMAKEELFRFRPLAALLRTFDAFPIRRGGADRQAMRIALSLLDQGRILIMFPEGHRRRGAERVKIERGAGMLAARSGAVIVPVLIRGSYRFFRPLQITFGKPFQLDDGSGGENPVLSAQAEEVESASVRRDRVDRATELIAMKMQELMSAASGARSPDAGRAP